MLRARDKISGIRPVKAIRIRQTVRAQPSMAGSAIVSIEYTAEAWAGRRAATNILTDPFIATALGFRLWGAQNSIRCPKTNEVDAPSVSVRHSNLMFALILTPRNRSSSSHSSAQCAQVCRPDRCKSPRVLADTLPASLALPSPDD